MDSRIARGGVGCKFPLDRFQTGDIVFRRLQGVISDIASRASPGNKDYSHVGLVIRDEEGVKVVHASEGDGLVREVDFCDFVRDSKKTLVIRPSAAGYGASSVLPRVKELIGRPFDYAFNLQDHSRLYCTELLMVIYPVIQPSPSVIGPVVYVDSVLRIPHQILFHSERDK